MQKFTPQIFFKFTKSTRNFTPRKFPATWYAMDLVELSFEVTLRVLLLVFKTVSIHDIGAQVLGFWSGHCFLFLDDGLEKVSAVHVARGLVFQPILRERSLASLAS